MKAYSSFKLLLSLFAISILSIGGYECLRHELCFCTVFVALLILILSTYICHLHKEPQRILRRMIEGIRFSDFSFSYPTHKTSKAAKILAQEMNSAIVVFRNKLCDTEVLCQYYETLLNTVDTGIFVIDADGNIEWTNRAATNEFNSKFIEHIDDLKSLNPDFPQALMSLNGGEVKVLRIQSGGITSEVAVTATIYHSKGRELRLINLKNIHSILEENEIIAWQKLIRVLTHEIMNSIAPIISLSETLCERVSINEKDYQIMLQAMETIHRRSKGLLIFVENYRKLARLSTPVLVPVKVGELLEDIKKLFPDNMVTYVYNIEHPEMILMIDRVQIEQVLINVIKNAVESCSSCNLPRISIETKLQRSSNNFFISVTDNGAGILPEVMDKIFVPFFTTKASGSGIGLSLCKQIINLHGGTISVTSETGKGCCFILKFTHVSLVD